MMKKTLPLIALLVVLFAGSAHAAYTGTTYNNDFLTNAGIDGNLSSYLQDAAGTGIWDITAVRSQAFLPQQIQSDGRLDGYRVVLQQGHEQLGHPRHRGY